MASVRMARATRARETKWKKATTTAPRTDRRCRRRSCVRCAALRRSVACRVVAARVATHCTAQPHPVCMRGANAGRWNACVKRRTPAGRRRCALAARRHGLPRAAEVRACVRACARARAAWGCHVCLFAAGRRCSSIGTMRSWRWSGCLSTRTTPTPTRHSRPLSSRGKREAMRHSSTMRTIGTCEHVQPARFRRCARTRLGVLYRPTLQDSTLSTRLTSAEYTATACAAVAHTLS